MGNTLAGESCADGEFSYITGVRGAHDALVVNTRILEKLIQCHVLLGMSSDYVVELHSGNGEHRLAIHLSVIQPIQEMNSAWTRSGKANAEPPGELSRNRMP